MSKSETLRSVLRSPDTSQSIKLTEEQRKHLGIPEGLIRYSVGIENVDDLLNDINEALKIV